MGEQGLDPEKGQAYGASSSGNEDVPQGLGAVSVTLKEAGEPPMQAKRSREKEKAARASTDGVLAVLRAVMKTH